MDSLIDLNDASKALDLDRIRFQLMFVPYVARQLDSVLPANMCSP